MYIFRHVGLGNCFGTKVNTARHIKSSLSKRVRARRSTVLQLSLTGLTHLQIISQGKMGLVRLLCAASQVIGRNSVQGDKLTSILIISGKSQSGTLTFTLTTKMARGLYSQKVTRLFCLSCRSLVCLSSLPQPVGYTNSSWFCSSIVLVILLHH